MENNHPSTQPKLHVYIPVVDHPVQVRSSEVGLQCLAFDLMKNDHIAPIRHAVVCFLIFLVLAI